MGSISCVECRVQRKCRASTKGCSLGQKHGSYGTKSEDHRHYVIACTPPSGLTCVSSAIIT